MLRHPSSRFAFTGSDNEDDTHKILFVDGQDFLVSELFAYALCDQRELNLQQLAEISSEKEQHFLVNLYNAGKLYQQEPSAINGEEQDE